MTRDFQERNILIVLPSQVQVSSVKITIIVLFFLSKTYPKLLQYFNISQNISKPGQNIFKFYDVPCMFVSGNPDRQTYRKYL